MARLQVRVPGHSYEVVVERGSVGGTAAQLAGVVRGRRLFVVSTEPVWRAQGERLERGLSGVAPAAGVTPILRRWIVGGYIYRGYRQGLKELE